MMLIAEYSPLSRRKKRKTFADKDGTKWRLAYFIEGSKSYESVTPQLAHAAGLAYGEFHAMLSDIPEGVLGETIPNFHNMSFRLMQLDEALWKLTQRVVWQRLESCSAR